MRSDNSTLSLQESSQIQSPSLLFSIYDPRLDLVEALNSGLTTMVLATANALTLINLGLRYHEPLRRPSFYDYGIPANPKPLLV